VIGEDERFNIFAGSDRRLPHIVMAELNIGDAAERAAVGETVDGKRIKGYSKGLLYV